MTAASSVRTYVPDVIGTVRLLEGVAGCFEHHLCGRAFPVEIMSLTSKGENRKTYAFRLHYLKGRLDKVTLSYELPGGEQHERVEYCVDTSFGSDLGSLTCNCMDFAKRGHKRKIPHCRHSKAVKKVCDILGAF